MTSRRRTRRFGALVHTGKIFVGGKTEGGARIPKKALRALVGRVATLTGGMTAYHARGIYRSEKQPFVSEPTTVIETFVDAGRSCSKFKKALVLVARQAAREGLQESVGVEVQCAGGSPDIELVKRHFGRSVRRRRC